MDSLETLLAIEAVKKLKARYWRTLDTRDWEGWRDCFTADARLFFPEIQEAPVTADEMVKWNIAFLEGAVSIHHGGAPEIEILDENHATGIWQVDDEIFWSGKPAPGGVTYLHGHGHYHESYERVGGHWKIATLRLSRLRTEFHKSSL